ncbi:hypothetical protein BJ986_001627 [Phycicoccus badiiscoriae]|uniref:Uncharacterized protein n=1 Tax=Pedococcus badiiscoriae TaxID=642776 RepID=A0A852WEH6_9MICO|nr:hypothetical protein [Pedococcus badiiscoriae]NYG07140.1 hypothetical protein [Pedococcus badiiscoriae]
MTLTTRNRRSSRIFEALLVPFLAAGAVLLTTSTASARGSDWHLWQPPVGAVVACGDTPVNLSFPYNKEYQRSLPPSAGTTDIQQFTGSLSVQFSTSAKTVKYNAGGPGTVTTYTNGDVLTRSEGHYNFAVSPQQAAQLGVPQIFGTVGLIEFITHPDGSMSPIRIPRNVISVCADLGL